MTKLNKLIYTEEELFETLDIFEVPMNNNNNDFRKMKEDLANKRNIIFHHTNMNKERENRNQTRNLIKGYCSN